MIFKRRGRITRERRCSYIELSGNFDSDSDKRRVQGGGKKSIRLPGKGMHPVKEPFAQSGINREREKRLV